MGEPQLVGWVRKSFPERGYGFISTDADPEKQIFFRIQNTLSKSMPEEGSVVRFRLVVQNIAGKNDRAVGVEVV